MSRVCVITGAAGGIGKEVVKKFYGKGYTVVLLDRNDQVLKAAVEQLSLEEGRYRCFALDISKEDQVNAAVAAIKTDLGRIDALVNAAGIVGRYALTADYGFDNFKNIYEVNVFGTFLMMQSVLPIMLEQKEGAIVNFGSVSGMRGYTLEVGYGSSKWAIIGMTRTVASEYGGKGIRANTVSPGWVETGMMHQSVVNYKELGTKSTLNLGPAGRAAKPSEIADAVYFLSSPEASHVNGANLLVDGGMIAG